MSPARPAYFGGELHAMVQGSGFTLSEVEYGPVRRCRRHTHQRAFFSLLTRGQYAECAGSERLVFRPFDVGFHPEGTEHADQIESPRSRFFLVELDRAWTERMRADGGRAPAAPRVCAPETRSVSARLCQIVREPGGSPLAVDDLLARLWGSLATRDTIERHRPHWLDRVLQLLCSEYARPLTLDGVASVVGLHPVYLSRAFRRFVGRGLGHHVNRLRVEAALHDLANTDLPIAELALRSGFADQSRLNKVVKHVTGLTPGAVRALSRTGRRRTATAVTRLRRAG